MSKLLTFYSILFFPVSTGITQKTAESWMFLLTLVYYVKFSQFSVVAATERGDRLTHTLQSVLHWPAFYKLSDQEWWVIKYTLFNLTLVVFDLADSFYWFCLFSSFFLVLVTTRADTSKLRELSEDNVTFTLGVLTRLSAVYVGMKTKYLSCCCFLLRTHCVCWVMAVKNMRAIHSSSK